MASIFMKFLGTAALAIVLSGTAQAQNREDVLDSHIAKILPHRALLTAFLREMPKGGDLHMHADGAIFIESMVAKAMESDPPVPFDLREKRFAYSGETPRRPLTPEQMHEDFLSLGVVLDALSSRNLDKQQSSGHDHFFSSFGRFGAAMPPPEAMATEIFTRAAAQKIRHLEPIISPPPPERDAYADEEAWNEASRLAPYDHIRWRLAYPDPAVRTAKYAKGVEEAVSVYEEARLTRLKELGLEPDDLSASYILFLDRSLEPDLFEEGLNNLIAAWNHCGPMLGGLTVVAPEDSWRSRLYFREQFKIVDRYVRDDSNWRDGVRPGFNWHAGELTLEYSTYEAMRDRIGETIWMGHANRIGHGTSIAWEDNAYELLLDMRTKGVCVEICPSSSAVILGVSGDDHPFHLYRAAGVAMVIATDDEGVARSNLTNEYVLAAQGFKLSYRDLKRLSRNSLEYSFLPGESLFENHDYHKRKALPPTESIKARMQAKLERDFVEFERYMIDRVLGEVMVE